MPYGESITLAKDFSQQIIDEQIAGLRIGNEGDVINKLETILSKRKS